MPGARATRSLAADRHPSAGALTAGSAAPRIAGIVLAAGRSRRFGSPKALAEVGGRALVRRAVDVLAAAGADPVVVVLGADRDAVAAALVGTTAHTVVNADHAAGIGTSLAAGARACPDDIDAVLVTTCDQPGTTAALVRSVIDAWRAGRGRIVRPFCGTVPAHPVLFDRALLAEIRAAAPDEGGRGVIARHVQDLAAVNVDDPAVVADCDTPAELARHAHA